MKIAEVIGKVTLSRCHPSLRGARWLIAVPLNHAGLLGDPNGREEEFVVYDELSPPVGAKIAVSDGAEAAAPFQPDTKPVDAYNSAILDQLDIEPI